MPRTALRDGIGPGEIVLLIALHPGTGHGRTQVGVLAAGFDDPPPARVAGNVNHRREDPCNSISAGLRRANARHCFNRRRVPACRQRQRHREGGPVAVDHIQPEEDGDVQPRFFHGDVLVVISGLHARHVQKGSRLALGRQLVVSEIGGARPGGISRGIRCQLAGLLVERHLSQQRLDARIQIL